MKFSTKNQGGFTLLELLVVVGIIAIIGGAMMSSFGGKEQKAARGVATQTIAGVSSAIRVFESDNKRLPNNLEALICTTYKADGNVTVAAFETDADTNSKLGKLPAKAEADKAYKFGGTSNVAGIGGGMSKKLAEKFVGVKLTANQATAFADVGLMNLRYAMSEACDTDPDTVASVAVNGIAATNFGASTEGLVGIDIVNQAFSDPRPNKDKNGYELRGVGFEGNVATGAPVLQWAGGTGGYNNKKVGAGADDRLIAFGIGENSDLVGTSDEAAFAKAPFYGQVGKDKYAHYIALFNTGTADNDDKLKAGQIRVQAVVDARGDFLDEEIAEFQGQKK